MNRSIWLKFLPAVIWLIISTVLFFLPGPAFPKKNWFDEIWLDKWIHIALFAIMVVLWARAFASRNLKKNLKRIFLWITAASCSYGITIEFLQGAIVPYRSFDLGDIIADIIGSVAGLIISNQRFIKK